MPAVGIGMENLDVSPSIDWVVGLRDEGGAAPLRTVRTSAAQLAAQVGSSPTLSDALTAAVSEANAAKVAAEDARDAVLNVGVITPEALAVILALLPVLTAATASGGTVLVRRADGSVGLIPIADLGGGGGTEPGSDPPPAGHAWLRGKDVGGAYITLRGKEAGGTYTNLAGKL